MNRKQIIETINIVCDYLDEKLQDKLGFIEIGIPISIDSIAGYKITSITTTTVKNEIAVSVKFECNGLWPYSVGKYYFLEKVGESFRLK